jgi:hypothetical protein
MLIGGGSGRDVTLIGDSGVRTPSNMSIPSNPGSVKPMFMRVLKIVSENLAVRPNPMSFRRAA